MKSTNQWTERTAPSLDDFEEIAAAAWETLPQQFRDLAGNVPCMVSEFPDEDTMREMELETEFDILGLFRGVGLPQGGATPFTGQMPNQVWLYRRPILDYVAHRCSSSAACASIASMSSSEKPKW